MNAVKNTRPAKVARLQHRLENQTIRDFSLHLVRRFCNAAIPLTCHFERSVGVYCESHDLGAHRRCFIGCFVRFGRKRCEKADESPGQAHVRRSTSAACRT